MRQLCPYCAYSYELLPAQCALCLRSLEGGHKLPFVGREAQLKRLTQDAEACVEAKEPRSIALTRAAQGGGVSALMQRLSVELSEGPRAFLVVHSHPFSERASQAQLEIPLIYQRLLESLFKLKLQDSLPERERWATRLLHQLSPPEHVREALALLLRASHGRSLKPLAHKTEVREGRESVSLSQGEALDPMAPLTLSHHAGELSALKLEEEFEAYKSAHLSAYERSFDDAEDESGEEITLELNSAYGAREAQTPQTSRVTSSLLSPPSSLAKSVNEHASKGEGSPLSIVAFDDLEGLDESSSEGLSEVRHLADPPPESSLHEELFTSAIVRVRPKQKSQMTSSREQLKGSLTQTLTQTLKQTLPPLDEDDPTRPPSDRSEDEPLNAWAEALVRLLSFYAQRQPLLLSFYDVHSATRADVTALTALLKALKRLDLPLLILIEQPPPSLDVLIEQRCELPALSFEEVVSLTRQALPQLLEPLAFVEQLMRVSLGEPHALCEALLKVSERHTLSEPRALLLSDLLKPTPRNLEELLIFVAASGPTSTRAHLKLIERCLDQRPWGVHPLEELNWEPLIQRAVEGGYLKETQHQRLLYEVSYRFTSASLKESYERLWISRYSTQERRALHRKLAEWMSTQEHLPEAYVQVGLTIAEHWISAGEPLEGARVSLEVAELLLTRGNHALAQSALEQARGLLDAEGGPWRLAKRLALLQAKVSLPLNQAHVAEPLLLKALKRAYELSDVTMSYQLGEQLKAIYVARGFHEKGREVAEWLSSLPSEALYEHVRGEGAIFDVDHMTSASRLISLSHPGSYQGAHKRAQESLPPLNAAQAWPSSRHYTSTPSGASYTRSVEMTPLTALPPPPSPVLKVLKRLQTLHHEAWVVGGSVRDRLLGRAVSDWDLTTSARPYEVIEAFERVIETGLEHGTVTVVEEGVHVEVTTYRVDGVYADGRRPESVSFTRSLKEDLARRDFTINAMAWDPLTQRLEDPFGGQSDLERGLVRAVGRPLDRFREDGLRTLRAVRFASTLAFEIEPQTWEGVKGALDVFQRVAAERVQVELFKTLLSAEAGRGMRWLKESQLLSLISPELDELDEEVFERALKALVGLPAQLEPRLALLFWGAEAPEQQAARTLQRLKCSRKLTQSTLHLLRWTHLTPSLERTDGQVRALSAQVGLSSLRGWLACQRLWAEAGGDVQSAEAWSGLEHRMSELKVEETPQSPRDLALKGNELAALLQLRPSPVIGELLNALLQHVWEHPTHNNATQLLALAPSFASALGVELSDEVRARLEVSRS